MYVFRRKFWGIFLVNVLVSSFPPSVSMQNAINKPHLHPVSPWTKRNRSKTEKGKKGTPINPFDKQEVSISQERLDEGSRSQQAGNIGNFSPSRFPYSAAWLGSIGPLDRGIFLLNFSCQFNLNPYQFQGGPHVRLRGFSDGFSRNWFTFAYIFFVGKTG